MKSTIVKSGSLFAICAALPWLVIAQETPQDTIGEHTVKAGETLQRITETYLGTYRLWRENWKLNPQIENPHKLSIGQKLRVILNREIPARSALVQQINNRVEKSLQRSDWENARPGDELKPDDGLQTLAQSSARLGFEDGSDLTLTENSQIFLRRMDETLTGVRRGTIELEKGQVDLSFRAPRPDRSEIEIVVGSSFTRPKPGSAGIAETRARLEDDGGGSQVMVYTGSSEVEAAGAKVQVPRGMGTSVPKDGPPSPPEKLLPRPETVSPERRDRFGFANPPFSWRPVEGAIAYTVEVCGDSECASLVARRAELQETKWRPEALPAGDHFWRVTAVSDSQLDGYPSRSLPFRIEDPRPDLRPPVVAASVVGASFAMQGDTLLLGPGAEIRLDARDDVSGIAEVLYRWNGGPWSRWQQRSLSPPAGDSNRLELQARDAAGRTSEIWTVDTSKAGLDPEPPTVRRGEGGGF